MASQNIEHDDGVWGYNIEKLFIEILVDEVNKGNQKNGIFASRIWKNILNEVNQKGGRRFCLKQVKQKYNRLRTKHRVFSELIQQTGFRWDAETNTVTAEDAVWDAYLVKCPKAHQFRRKGCEHYKLLGIIFNRSIATDVLHHASTIDPPNSNEERQLDNQYINDRIHINVDENVEKDYVAETTKRSTHKGKRTITMPEYKSKKDRTSNEMSEALQASTASSKVRMEESLARAKRYRPKNVTTSSMILENDYSHVKCVKMLSSLEDISDDVYFAALDKFNDEGWRQMFLTMPMERKKAWLTRLI